MDRSAPGPEFRHRSDRRRKNPAMPVLKEVKPLLPWARMTSAGGCSQIPSAEAIHKVVSAEFSEKVFELVRAQITLQRRSGFLGKRKRSIENSILLEINIRFDIKPGEIR